MSSYNFLFTLISAKNLLYLFTSLPLIKDLVNSIFKIYIEMSKKTNAAILIIGNEILSGRTQDTNTSTLSLYELYWS